MLALLLGAKPKSTVSVEVFDDVGLEEAGEIKAVQTKSTVSAANPVSNGAKPFWKSLHNWLLAIEAGHLKLDNTQFELYVFGDFRGEICTSFSDAKDRSTGQTALEEARKAFGADPDGAPEHVQAVLNHDENVLLELIVRFQYAHGTGDSQSDLETMLLQTAVPSELVDVVLKYLLGWVKQRVDSLIEKNLPARIEVDEFRRALTSFVRSLVFAAVFTDLSGPPESKDIEEHKSKIYVRQLDLIDVGDERKIRAITTFLSASTNRTEWGRRGLLNETGLDEFEKHLKRHWENSRETSELLFPDGDTNRRGRWVLVECSRLNLALEGRAVPTDFVEGCYHALADDLAIGWHPDFQKLLRGWGA